MRKFNLFASGVAVASLVVMVMTYALAFSNPARSVLVMVDSVHEGLFEFALILIALLVCTWHLAQEVKVCAQNYNG